jgi:hypothetical protein
MELVRGDGPMRFKDEEEAQRASDQKKLACMPAGVVSPGTRSCADDKGPLRKEVGGRMT